MYWKSCIEFPVIMLAGIYGNSNNTDTFKNFRLRNIDLSTHSWNIFISKTILFLTQSYGACEYILGTSE